MTLDLPGDVLENLPDPDDQGLVRVAVALRMGEDGTATVMEINDVPVSSEEDDADELPEEAAMPSADDVAAQMMM